MNWNDQSKLVYCKVKELLCAKPMLRYPDFDKPFTMQTNASNRGVGAVLSQKDAEGTDYPIAYFSRKLLPREQHYSTVEKNALSSNCTSRLKAWVMPIFSLFNTQLSTTIKSKW